MRCQTRALLLAAGERQQRRTPARTASLFPPIAFVLRYSGMNDAGIAQRLARSLSAREIARNNFRSDESARVRTYSDADFREQPTKLKESSANRRHGTIHRTIYFCRRGSDRPHTHL